MGGGPGDDTFRTCDGEVDVIDCGPGVDTALLDFRDQIADASMQNRNGSCEVVNRERRVKKGDDQRESVDRTENVSPS
jgi:hypothetical protein